MFLLSNLSSESKMQFIFSKAFISFTSLVDVYILACSIGIKDDRTLSISDEQSQGQKTIRGNTYMSLTNTGSRGLLDFMLQNAIINSKTLNLSVDDRLKLAFDPDFR